MSKDGLVSKIPKTLYTIRKSTICTVTDHPDTLQNGYKGTGYHSYTCQGKNSANTCATAFLAPDVKFAIDSYSVKYTDGYMV
jgi:hypothetical protein